MDVLWNDMPLYLFWSEESMAAMSFIAIVISQFCDMKRLLKEENL